MNRTLAVVLLTMMPTLGMAADLVTNGSLENGPPLNGSECPIAPSPCQDVEVPVGSTAITGWQVFQAPIDYLASPWDASDGSRAVDLNSCAPGGIMQIVPTAPGRTYALRFDRSGNPGGAPQLKQLRVNIDGHTHDYDFDTGGQTQNNLTWLSTSISFVASSSTTTVAFLSVTSGCYGPLVDGVSVVELSESCEYPFTSGSGASLLSYCVSANGTLTQIESPAGAQHLAVGQLWEGYVVCRGSTAYAWDLTESSEGFDEPIVLKATSKAVTIRRTNSSFQLDQQFSLDAKNRAILITATLTNLRTEVVPDVRLVRSYDPDLDGDASSDQEDASARGTWARDINALALTATTPTFAVETAVDAPPLPNCAPNGGTPPLVTGDGRLATVIYRLGNMPKRAKRTVVFTYRIQ